MRVVRRMLLAVTGCLVVAFLLAAASAGAGRPTAIQTGSYPWVQPWTGATVVQPSVQPAMAGTGAVKVFLPPASYPWVQPWGGSRTGASVQPPSWIPVQ